MFGERGMVFSEGIVLGLPVLNKQAGWASLVAQTEVSVCSAGDLGLIPGLGRSPGEGNGSPLQYSCPENPMDGSLPGSAVHGVAKSQTRLRDFPDFTHSQ